MRFWASTAALACLFCTATARAADIYAPAPIAAPIIAPVAGPDLYDPTRWELRAGAFAHGIGSVEKGTWDVNGELVLPKFFVPTEVWWNALVPRIHAGVNANTGGRTSATYAGLLWTVPVLDRFFVEGFLDAAFHNGSKLGDATHNALGCNPLFHVGGSVGYRFDRHWSIMGTFDHLSNGSGLGLTNCGRNQGVNSYGARIGYTF